MPDLRRLSDFTSRVCCGGIGVLLAISRDKPYDDFIIPIQIRSSMVSDGRNMYAVFPKAFHEKLMSCRHTAVMKMGVHSQTQLG